MLSDSRSLNGNLMSLTANSETKDAVYAVHMIEPPIKEIKTSPLKELQFVTFDSNDVPPKLVINDVQNMLNNENMF